MNLSWLGQGELYSYGFLYKFQLVILCKFTSNPNVISFYIKCRQICPEYSGKLYLYDFLCKSQLYNIFYVYYYIIHLHILVLYPVYTYI